MKPLCPECGSDMMFQGYRPLFPTCTKCEGIFHMDECKKEE